VRVDESAAPGASARPNRYADPRALSQAWYDALYPTRARVTRAAPPARPTQAFNPELATRHIAPPSVALSAATAWHTAPRHARGAQRTMTSASAEALLLQRLASLRCTRLECIETAQRDAPAVRVELEQADGSPLRLLLQTIAARVRVVASCSPVQRDRVADALHRTRAALAARGIAFDYEVHVA